MPFNISRKTEKMELVREHLRIPFHDRVSLPLFRKEHKIRRDEYLQLKSMIEEEEKNLVKKRVTRAQRWMEESLYGEDTKMTAPLRVSLDKELEAERWLEANYPDLLEYTFEAAKKGNAASQKLLAQLMGKLVEKSEVKLEISADDMAKRNLEAQRQLKEEGYGTDSG